MSTPIDPTSAAGQTPPIPPTTRTQNDLTPDELAQEARLRQEQSAPPPEQPPEPPPHDPSRGGTVDQVV
jgi:hypothetical protein